MMNTDRLTPEEFARLVALPENDPERVRAAHRPDFEAHLRLYREFESPTAVPEHAPADARQLAARVLDNVRPERAREGPSWLAGLVHFFAQPAPRAALALGALVVVAGTATWFAGRNAGPDRAVRGEAGSTFVIAEPRKLPNGLELSWTAVPGATGYRVLFYGADLHEITRVDQLKETRLLLDPAALPAGLTAGQEVLVEVSALSGTDPMVTTSNRAVRLP